MALNFDCKYYERQEKQRKVIRNTFSEIPPVVIHKCNHPANKPHAVTFRECNTDNDFCPYNPDGQHD